MSEKNKNKKSKPMAKTIKQNIKIKTFVKRPTFIKSFENAKKIKMKIRTQKHKAIFTS